MEVIINGVPDLSKTKATNVNFYRKAGRGRLDILVYEQVTTINDDVNQVDTSSPRSSLSNSSPLNMPILLGSMYIVLGKHRQDPCPIE